MQNFARWEDNMCLKTMKKELLKYSESYHDMSWQSPLIKTLSWTSVLLQLNTKIPRKVQNCSITKHLLLLKKE